jgi:uncharacterized protein DUF3551
MRKLIIAGLAASAAFATLGQAHAYVNYPWCAMGETRGMECVFSTKEQCAQDGRGRGFGTQCIQNPGYNPALGSVVERGHAQTAAAQVPRKSRKHSDHR